MLKLLAATSLLFAWATVPSLAANFDVQMLNKGESGTMVFEPPLTKIALGDTVTFIPTDKGHNAESIPDILPKGAQPFKGKINERIVVTFDAVGAYGIKCLPHFAMGMVALVVVGEPANIEQVNATTAPKRAKDRLIDLAAQVSP